MANTIDGKTEYKAKIGLMYLHDNSCTNSRTKFYIYSQWMFMGLYDWTITRRSDMNTAFFVNCTDAFDILPIRDYNAVRPVFNLVPSTTYISGTGTISDPIIIN